MNERIITRTFTTLLICSIIGAIAAFCRNHLILGYIMLLPSAATLSACIATLLLWALMLTSRKSGCGHEQKLAERNSSTGRTFL